MKPQKTKSIKTKSPIYTIASVFFVILALYFGYNFYLDWQNKRLIEGMAEDYPELIAGVEQAIGIPLSISSDCMTTQEKFGGGVSLCGLTVGLSREKSQEIIIKSTNYIETSPSFEKGHPYRNGAGYEYLYAGTSICTVNHTERVYIDCAFGVRNNNKNLASDLLSEEALNARKDEILKELQASQ